MCSFPKISLFLLLVLCLGCGKQPVAQGLLPQRNEKSFEFLSVDNEFSFSPSKKYNIFSNGKSGFQTTSGPHFLTFADHQPLKVSKENSLFESSEINKIKTEWFLLDQSSKPEVLFEDKRKHLKFNSVLQLQLESSQNFYNLTEFPKSDGYHFSLSLVINETFLKNNVFQEIGDTLKISGKGCDRFADDEDESSQKNGYSGCFFKISEIMAFTSEKSTKKPIRYYLFNRDLKFCSFEIILSGIQKNCPLKDSFLCSNEGRESHKINFPYADPKSKVVLKIKCTNEKNEILFKSRFSQNGVTL